MSNLKVEGKVADFCPKCKNCKSTTRECDRKKDWLTEVRCEDPYDGMVKTLDADSDICCSMFIPKGDMSMEKKTEAEHTICCKTCKYFYTLDVDKGIGTCHVDFDYKRVKGINGCPLYEKRELQQCCCSMFTPKPDHGRYPWGKESCDKISILQHELEMDRLRKEIHQLKLRNDNQVTMIQGLKLQYNDLSEKLERVESHDEALTKHFQNDEALINNIQKVIFPQEEGCDYTYSYDEILNKVKELKVHADENDTLYKDLDCWRTYWMESCHKAEADVTTLNSKIEVLEKKLKRQECLNDINADIMPRLMLENQRLLTRNRKLQVRLNDILLNPESNRLEEEDK